MKHEAGTILTRRQFCRLATVAALTVGSGVLAFPAAAQDAFPTPRLLYPESSLEPIISAQTVSYHYGKHTRAYYANTSTLTTGTQYEKMKLRQIVLATHDKPDRRSIYNNAAQAMNHTFYWNGLAPLGGGRPGGRLAELIERDFGSFGRMSEDLVVEAGKVFGSGWVWLAIKNGKLDIMRTQGAGTPITSGATPLLVIDVWEHAYYLDYQNRRKEYVQALLHRLVNWNRVTMRLDRMRKKTTA
ncbi:Fe-Mn family superoxide dismutase [Desulfobaculum xiamenense]|uniref:Superoxide dismutase n=1 Tax=Desulfobaculum xiamenense TaxID=995050 RepID=A0A846QG46_9BACT|nr:superoxide dismutase [Desulfobaculum xiamenense]NJB67278.1 Fe-Mn family superoxide dismutase [Desulfobaculum xiamenense]